MDSPSIKPETLSGSPGSLSIESETMAATRATDAPPKAADHNNDGPKDEQPQLNMEASVPAANIPESSPAGIKRDFSGK